LNTSRSAQTPTISINAGATITCTVAAIAHHPDSGVIVTIPGNPNGFIPNRLIAGNNNAAKAERRQLMIANPGMALEVFVEEAGMAAAKVDESQPAKTNKPAPSSSSTKTRSPSRRSSPPGKKKRLVCAIRWPPSRWETACTPR
jgi:hypothetical protein